MKKLAIVLACLVLFHCKDVDDLLTFTISDQVTITVPSSSPFNLPVELATPDVTTNSSQKFANNNTEASLVKDIRLQELTLAIQSPSGKTFSFLKSIHIYISTNSSNEILLASLDNIPTSVTSISLTPTQEKPDVYAKASSYKLRTSIVTRETLTQNVEMKTDLKFRVTAAPL
ncbi:MAG TPA: hypothetical protein VGD65_21915 [Chryseosolibacter sp.]